MRPIPISIRRFTITMEVFARLKGKVVFFADRIDAIGIVGENVVTIIVGKIFGMVVVFNPQFSVPLPIGGSDADFYLDGTLYDFKVVSSFRNWKQEVEQILGYYFLDRLAKEKKAGVKCSLQDCPILHLAFYEARLGEVIKCDVTGTEPFAQGYRDLGSLLAK